MSNRNIQILELAKQGLTALEIAEALGDNVEVIEMILKADPEMGVALRAEGIDPEKITERQKTEAELKQTKETFKALEPIAARRMKELIQNAEKDSVSADLCKYVFNQRLGLMEPKQNVSINLNLGDFNNRMKEARKRREELDKKNSVDITDSCSTVTVTT